MRGMWTYTINDLSDGLSGNIRLKMSFNEWKVTGDLFKVLGVNFTLNWRAARGCESVDTHRRH